MIAYKPGADEIAVERLKQRHAGVGEDLDVLQKGAAAGSASLNLLSRWYGAKAVYGATDPGKPEGIDWQAWRMAHEYSALFTRSAAREGGPASAQLLTRILMQAMSLDIFQHTKAAQRTLKGVSAPMIELIERMNHADDRPKIKTGDLAVIGLLFDRITGLVPRHSSFAHDARLLTRKGIARIAEGRKSYAEANSEAPAILSGYYFKVIPLEQIYANLHAPKEEQDANLTAFAVAMRATQYPDDDQLISYDERLMEMKL